jgi:hypothetical protein
MSIGLMELRGENAVKQGTGNEGIRKNGSRSGGAGEKAKIWLKNKTAMSNGSMGLRGATDNSVFAFSSFFVLLFRFLSLHSKKTKGSRAASLFLTI